MAALVATRGEDDGLSGPPSPPSEGEAEEALTPTLSRWAGEGGPRSGRVRGSLSPVMAIHVFSSRDGEEADAAAGSW
jgi:hypothetical protein